MSDKEITRTLRTETRMDAGEIDLLDQENAYVSRRVRRHKSASA